MPKKPFLFVLFVFACVLSGHLIWEYLRFPIHGALSYLLGIGVFFLLRHPLSIQSKALWGVSFLFALSLVLSKHIVLGGGVTALSDTNYITGYSAKDLVALAVLVIVGSQALSRLLLWAGSSASNTLFSQNDESAYGAILKKPTWLLIGGLIFCWLPWLLSWYPGFIYGDSISSIMQAQGLWGFNNHHPICYTLWVKLWVTLGIKLYDVSFGIFLYTVSQMVLVAWTMVWSARWMHHKGVNAAWCVMTLAYFALTPFFAQNNISMWKDPLFSCAVLILCLRLYDYFSRDGKLNTQTVFWVGLFSCFVCALRNNGAYVILFTALASVALLLRYRTPDFRKKASYLSGAMFVLAALTLAVQGPLFNKLHINQSYAETVGMPLNQMARVVVYNGSMSEENKAFMGKLYPLEKYKEVYAPGIVDRLKWAAGFDAGYLGSHRNAFFKNYTSMVIKNPRLAFEGWELLTVGYWSVTHFTFDTGNIPKGCLWCFKWWTKDHGIKTKNLLENRFFDSRAVFNQYDATIPISLLTWLVILIAALTFARKNAPAQMATLPLLAILLSLFLATPIQYWERYAYALSLAAPLLIVLFIRMSRFILRKGKTVFVLQN